MPELPEVETVLRGLRPSLVGRTIAAVEMRADRTFRAREGLTLEDLPGVRIEGLWRRGKMLFWDLSGGKSLVFHFKLTGQAILGRDGDDRYVGGHPIPSPGAPVPGKTTRAVFRLDDGTVFYFNDLRRFGWILLMPTAGVDAFLQAQRLGPEPFSPEFTPASLGLALRRHARAPIKSVLLDQSVVAGLGNIYTDEALSLAAVNPLRRAGTLSPEEVDRLHQGILRTLAVAVEEAGATIIGTRAVPKGERGEFPRVHGRAGQPCFTCGAPIERIRIGGRSSYYCPRCQVG